MVMKKKPMAVKQAIKQTLINWVETAWKKLKEKPDMVAKLFVVTGITPKVDGSEKNLIRNDELQQVIETTCRVEEVDGVFDSSDDKSVSSSDTD